MPRHPSSWIVPWFGSRARSCRPALASRLLRVFDPTAPTTLPPPPEHPTRHHSTLCRQSSTPARKEQQAEGGREVKAVMHDSSSHTHGSRSIATNHHGDPSVPIPAATTIPNNANLDSVTTTTTLSERCALVHAKVYAFLAAPPRNERMAAVQRQTRISLDVIAEALRRFSLSELSFSYNGGKDCLVLLILYLTALHTAASEEAGSTSAGSDAASSASPSDPPASNSTVATTTNNVTSNSATTTTTTTTTTTLPPPSPSPSPRIKLPERLPSIYIVPPNPFPSVTAFVGESSETYHLSLTRSTRPMREAFAAYLTQHPAVRAIFVGTRRTDPHGASLTHFDPTDGGWPAFVRVHPVIDWHYAEIWAFLRDLGVPYCELYDRGYTSLGGTTDTLPNPALRRVVTREKETETEEGMERNGGGGEGERGAVKGEGGGMEEVTVEEFRPAYELIEDEEERLGRDR